MDKLRAKFKELKLEAQSIVDSAKESNDGIFTAEQTEKYNEIKDKMASIESQMASMKEMDDLSGKIGEPEAVKTNAVTTVKVIKEAYEETGGFKDSHDFLKAVQDSTVNPFARDKRLEQLATAGSDEAKLSSNPDGGFLVPRGFLNMLMKTDANGLQYDTGQFTRKIPMGFGGVDVPARVDKTHSDGSVTGGFKVYRKAETSAATASQSEYEQISLKPVELIGATYATEMLLKANPMSFASIIQTSFGEEFTSKLNAERLTGTSAGQYLGVLNSAALVTVAKVTSQTADTINFTNIVNMFSRMYNPSQAVWLCNHNTLPQLMSLADAGSNLVWQDSLVEGPVGRILGRPVYLDENCETLGDKGDIYFINWNEYLEGTVGGMDMDESIHVRFLENERAYRFVKYNDARPWWTSALTPKKGSTLSPFVTLAARA